ncbi:MAG: DoxX family protein [Deltaproteobacteria bacterium]|nr:DoxX family protein [Deltaproteobacteria bacterium]
MRQTYDKLVSLASHLQSPLLLLLRLYWGAQFILAGKGKLTNIEKVFEFFQGLHIPLPLASAYLVGSTELLGGMLLVLGLGSRLAAIPLSITMIVAYLTAHIEATRNILSDPENFIDQAPFLFLLVTLILLAFGPGRFSLDAWLEKKIRL